jgi:uncharacterized membrane protein
MGTDNIVEQSYPRRRHGPRVRQVFFLLTAFWGYFLGIATLAIVIRCVGTNFVANPLCWIITLMTIVAAGLGSFIFHRAYIEYRKRRSHV